MNNKVSIIIPCFNTQNTLEETLESVYNQDYDNWEAILINDGSPDDLEEIAMKWEKKDVRFKYYKKDNGGLGSARNYGVEKSKGCYILPLDSDNKIRPDFVSSAIKILDKNLKIGVVYGDAMYFGEKSGEWIVGDFDKFRLLKFNYIDACAIIRKTLFNITNGYDVLMPHQGHEDWDFWLQVLKTDYDFYYLNSITFDYRVLSNSMIRSLDKSGEKMNVDYLRNKHKQLYFEAYLELYNHYNNLKKINDLPIHQKVYIKIRRLLKKVI